MEDQSILEWLGVSGLLAIIGGAMGYGHLHGRVKAVEEDVKDLSKTGERLARLETKMDMLLKANGVKHDA